MRSFTFPARQSLILLAILILLTASALAADKDYGDRTQARPALERVSVPLTIIDVGDGDTVTLHWNEEDTERVRILGIDTPEVAHPRWGST
jgi:endonuclease YncB( thermonuclease family)